MSGTGAGHTARKNLCTLRNEFAKLCNVLIINKLSTVNAEVTYLLRGLRCIGLSFLSIKGNLLIDL